jgi:hypothetical protein
VRAVLVILFTDFQFGLPKLCCCDLICSAPSTEIHRVNQVRARCSKPYASNGQDKAFIADLIPVHDIEPFTVDGKKVYDPRKLDPFKQPEASAVLIIRHHEATQAAAPITDAAREGSPARSDRSCVSNATALQVPDDVITYPIGSDGQALIVSIENPKLNGWLPCNPVQDYKIEILPSGTKVITSESLGILKYVAMICLV